MERVNVTIQGADFETEIIGKIKKSSLSIVRIENDYEGLFYAIDGENRIHHKLPANREVIDVVKMDNKDIKQLYGVEDENGEFYVLIGDRSELIDIDFDEYRYTLQTCYKVKEGEDSVEIIDELSIVQGMSDAFSERKYSSARETLYQKFALNYFFKEWPVRICLSKKGEYILNYYEDLNVFLISKLIGGNVYAIFENEFSYNSDSKQHIEYDDEENILKVSLADGTTQTYIISPDKCAVDELNDFYNNVYRIDKLRNQHSENEITKFFYKVLLSTTLQCL